MYSNWHYSLNLNDKVFRKCYYKSIKIIPHNIIFTFTKLTSLMIKKIDKNKNQWDW